MDQNVWVSIKHLHVFLSTCLSLQCIFLSCTARIGRQAGTQPAQTFHHRARHWTMPSQLRKVCSSVLSMFTQHCTNGMNGICSWDRSDQEDRCRGKSAWSWVGQGIIFVWWCNSGDPAPLVGFTSIHIRNLTRKTRMCSRDFFVLLISWWIPLVLLLWDVEALLLPPFLHSLVWVVLKCVY